jgi:hypothetical protein
VLDTRPEPQTPLEQFDRLVEDEGLATAATWEECAERILAGDAVTRIVHALYEVGRLGTPELLNSLFGALLDVAPQHELGPRCDIHPRRALVAGWQAWSLGVGSRVAAHHSADSERHRRPLSFDGCYLPADFWQARPELAHVQAAAHSRGRSPDAVLGAVLARLSADTPHPVQVPAVVGVRQGCPNWSPWSGLPGRARAQRSASPRSFCPPSCWQSRPTGCRWAAGRAWSRC